MAVEWGLTLPIFLFYHFGVIFLGIRNGADPLTGLLFLAVNGNLALYLAITAGIGLCFFAALAMTPHGNALNRGSFARIALEGAVYAVVMRFAASFLVGRIFMGPPASHGVFVGAVLSAGAGFYEELVFRVVLFGVVGRILLGLFDGKSNGVGLRITSISGFVVVSVWALLSAAIFSSMHYLGPLGDPFDLVSFAFRSVVGLLLTVIYVTRGFAASVWTHTLYDVWVTAL